MVLSQLGLEWICVEILRGLILDILGYFMKFNFGLFYENAPIMCDWHMLKVVLKLGVFTPQCLDFEESVKASPSN